jgi:hypothetical protein
VLTCGTWSFPDVILVFLITQIWTEFLSGGKMMAYAFFIQKMPSVGVSWHVFTQQTPAAKHN